jgi:hypothetical protein
MSTRGVLVTLCGAAIALSGCGAKEAAVVKSAFEKDIKSANVDLSIGIKSQQEAVNITVTGPYQSNGEGRLPSADLAFKVEGGPQEFEGKLISTGKNAFVVYQGQTYEVGEQTIAQLQKQGQSEQLSTADLSKLMGTMSDWFPESKAQDAELGGEPVDRVTGKLDLSRALKDLNGFLKKSHIKGAEQLSTGDINAIDDSVSDPKFTIDAPSSGRPIEELMRKLFGAGNEDTQVN